jgi:hypothetical protein
LRGCGEETAALAREMTQAGLAFASLRGGAMSASDIGVFPFDEVDEIVPGRICQVAVGGRVIRLYVCRRICGDHHVEWSSRFDELVRFGGVEVWTTLRDAPNGQPCRDEVSCFSRGIMWLANYLGVDG